MPLNSAVNCVPSARPRCSGCAVSAVIAMKLCMSDEHMPVIRLPAASTAIDGAIAIIACASSSTTILYNTSRRLSIRSPSGTKNTMPASMPPKESVGIQPVAAASASNSAAIAASMGV